MQKLTAKQEKFCQVFHATGNKSEAYRQAYNCENMQETSINRKAVEVHANVNVTARMQELQEASLNRLNITVDTIAKMYGEAFKVAKTNGQASAMASSATGMAKLYGLDAITKIQLDKINEDKTESDSEPLTINFSVAEAKSDVTITNG